jgi:hypothetical protein
MMRTRVNRSAAACFFALSLAFASTATGQDYKPIPYQPGRDVLWVPTPQVLVEKMLDMAHLTPQDIVVDLGSGDGRNVIAAARRGARSRGVEFNPNLVELSKRLATEAGVTAKASFVEGDMYVADISDATVLPLFLMPENLDKLAPTFLKLRPGTRIVNNAFEFTDWEYDEIGRLEGPECERYCVAYLYIVPAQVAGVWRMEKGELELTQQFQMLTGTITIAGKRMPIERGRLQGDVVRFNVDKARYTGRVVGNTIVGTLSGAGLGPWKAER